MRVTIIGTGNMARAISVRALAGGHQVGLVGTHVSKARELADELLGEGPVDAADELAGEIVVLAVPYTEAPHVVREYSDQLVGRTIVDPTNPVDLTVIEPLDRAWVGDFGSGGQLIAAEAPDGVGFVKAFNTNFAGPLLAGHVAGEALDVFVAGDDPDHKAKVMQLVHDGGMRPVDAGRLARARELEAMALVHMEIQGPRGTRFSSAIRLTP
jgi:8-hydroxy-5-deazaflavin:NADPH oxidoreductase